MMELYPESTHAAQAGPPWEQNEIPKALQEPTHSKSLLFLILYGVGNMVMGVGNIAVATVLLPMQIASLTQSNQTSIFSLILGIGAVAAVLTNPLGGMLSDRTTSRFGRRRPWLIAGGVLTVVALLLLAITPSLLAITLEWVLLQIGINLVQVALSAILPDQVPVRQRGIVSAFANGSGFLLGGLLGQILVTEFFKAIPIAYTSIAVTIAIMLLLFLFVLHDIPLSKEHIPSFHVKQLARAYWLNPMAYPDFARTWLACCLTFLGYTTVVNFMFYFLQDVIHYSRLFPGQTTAQGVQTFFAINVGSIIVVSLMAGLLSDKLQRRKVFVIVSSLIMMVGLLLYAFFPTWSMVVIATVLLGIGYGIFLSVGLALASQVLPTAIDRGKDIGLINAALYLPMIFSPVLAGITLSALHSYLVLFLLLAVGSLIAALLIIPIKTVR
jgi:MFS family permease